MAAKLLHSLADDNPDLQKQIGCMTGIFQLFDRQHMIAGRRITQKRLPPPGTSHYNINGAEREIHNGYNRQAADEINYYKSGNERQRFSTESSRASFSSSCSSSLSSLECSKATQPEPSSFDRIIFPETPSRDPTINQWSTATSAPHRPRSSTDLKDVVKDSMNREARGLSVKTSSREEAAVAARPLKHKDSPRPQKNENAPVDLEESFRVLAKLRDAPWYYNDTKEIPAARFSCDGREVNRLSFESRETIRSAMKLKELPPRLSLDSREGSMLRNNGFAGAKGEYFPRSSGTQSRPTSVVAKLMGLEALPDSAASNGNRLSSLKNGSVEETDGFVRPVKAKELMLPIRGFNKSTRSSMKEPTSPRWKGHDKAMKPISRSPNEPAPWKQPVPKPINIQQMPLSSSSSPSVYGEIEKRLKDLEFKQSGKDLRALKQILEAIQAKGLLETRKEEQPSNFGRDTVPSKNTRLLENSRNPHRGSGSKAFESPIVIMKPAKLVEKYGIDASVVSVDSLSADAKKVATRTRRVKDQAVAKVDSGDKRTKPSPKPQRTQKESSSSSVKGTGSISPRLQQKKLELERRSRPPTPPSDSNRARRQPSRLTSESNSPGGRRRPKYTTTTPRPSDDQLSEASNESRTLSCIGDDISVHSDCDQMQKVELASQASEHRSPVSVLDVSAYTDDASPVKEEPNSLKDETIRDSSPDDNSTEINRKKLQNIDQLVQKLRRLNSTHDEERTDYIASLCENTNPDHRYISEILVASGLLLRDLGSNSAQFQLHPSGHPINPELFFVLEQTKGGAVPKVPGPKPDQEKARRRLIFDSVNEILVQKLSLSGFIGEPQGGRPGRLARKSLKAQKLLKELCLEIEQLENKKPECCPSMTTDVDDPLKGILWEDVMEDRSGGWTDFHGETSGIVLDVERSIFKDLVNEVLMLESWGVRARPSRRRQLFAK